MTVLWLVLPLFIFTQLSWKWGKLRFIRLKHMNQLPEIKWNRFSLWWKYSFFLLSHKWWCQQWLSRCGNWIWKWAPTACHTLCQMFRPGDTFCTQWSWSGPVKINSTCFALLSSQEARKQRKIFLSQIGLNVQKPLQSSYFWSIYSSIPVICMKQKQRSMKCVGKSFIISLHQFREWV